MKLLEIVFGVVCFGLIAGAAVFGGVKGALIACILLTIGIAIVSLRLVALRKKVF